MNKTVIFAVLLFALGLFAGLYFISLSMRYQVHSAANGLIYKIDGKTGRTWIIYRGREKLIRGDGGVPAVEDPGGRAIDLARNSFAFGRPHSVDAAIRYMLERKKGELHIGGWKAEKRADQTYLVSFLYRDESGENGYFFEVNLEAEIVRNVLGDRELEKKYDLEKMGEKKRRTQPDRVVPPVRKGRGV